MIGHLRGKILEKYPPLVLVETNGIGYEVYMPLTCFHKFPEIGKEASIYTHFIVRDDAQILYGFNNKQERSVFREIIKVNGIGPKLALAILSGLSIKQLISAVEHEDITILITLPGVGKKTAERLVMEMKGPFKGINSDVFTQITETATGIAVTDNDIEAEAVSALVSLGYKCKEAKRMIRDIAKSGTDCESLIRNALRAAL